MKKYSKHRESVSYVREHFTHLEELIRPGEVLSVRKRGKPYVRLQLEAPENQFEFLDSFVYRNRSSSMPETFKIKTLRRFSDHKSYLYGTDSPVFPATIKKGRKAGKSRT